MIPWIAAFWFWTTPQISPCTGAGEFPPIQRPVRISLLHLAAGGTLQAPQIQVAGSLLRLVFADGKSVDMRLPAQPHRVYRKHNLLVLALGRFGIHVVDILDPGVPVVVLKRKFEQPVDGFLVDGWDILPTLKNNPLEVTDPCPEPRGGKTGISGEVFADLLPLLKKRPVPPARAMTVSSELALFSTAHTLPAGMSMLQGGIFHYQPILKKWGVLGDFLLFKHGWSDRLQVGICTIPSVAGELLKWVPSEKEAVPVILGLHLGCLHLKYKFFESGNFSMAINAYTPVSEWVGTYRHGNLTFSLAAGTSTLSLYTLYKYRILHGAMVRGGLHWQAFGPLGFTLEGAIGCAFELCHAGGGAGLRLGKGSVHWDVSWGIIQQDPYFFTSVGILF